MDRETSRKAVGENAEPFNPALLTNSLKQCLFGKRVIFRDTLGSTNVFLKGLAQDGAVEGTVVIADEQSAGLGRLGRQWFSKKGQNLLFSVLLRPNLPPNKIFALTMMFALAGIDAIEEISGLNGMIKWPNDIYIGENKIGGILTEFSVLKGIVLYVVLGMGLNVNWQPDAEQTLLYSTSSILNETKKSVSREKLLCKLLERFEKNYNVAKEDMSGREELFKRWNEKSLVLGRTVTLETGKERVEGEVKGIDRDGALMLITTDGQNRKFVCGDVSVKIKFSKEK